MAVSTHRRTRGNESRERTPRHPRDRTTAPTVGGVRTQHAAPATPRPRPLQWLRYAFGGRLPRRLAPWVLSDTTRPGWVLRHVVRSLVQLSPLVVICLVAVPVELGYRVTAAAGGLMVGLMYSLAFMVETTEHRVAKAGYPAGTAAQVREERAERAREARVEQRHPYRTGGAGSFD
jgi:Family of unknown function (DUF5313)